MRTLLLLPLLLCACSGLQDQPTSDPGASAVFGTSNMGHIGDGSEYDVPRTQRRRFGSSDPYAAGGGLNNGGVNTGGDYGGRSIFGPNGRVTRSGGGTSVDTGVQVWDLSRPRR